MMWLVEIAGVICHFCLCVATCTIVKVIHPSGSVCVLLGHLATKKEQQFVWVFPPTRKSVYSWMRTVQNFHTHPKVWSFLKSICLKENPTSSVFSHFRNFLLWRRKQFLSVTSDNQTKLTDKKALAQFLLSTSRVAESWRFEIVSVAVKCILIGVTGKSTMSFICGTRFILAMSEHADVFQYPCFVREIFLLWALPWFIHWCIYTMCIEFHWFGSICDTSDYRVLQKLATANGVGAL